MWRYAFCELYLMVYFPTADVIYDMLLVKSKQTVVSVLCNTDADLIIDPVHALCIFLCAPFCTYLYNFYNK